MASGHDRLRLHPRRSRYSSISRRSTLPRPAPKDEGGYNTLFDPNVPGIKLIGRHSANAQHTLFFIMEADHVNAIHKFLYPAFCRCTSTVTP
jgi:hypothetical protein